MKEAHSISADKRNPMSRPLQRWRWFFMLAGVLIVATWAAAARWPGPIQAIDIEQSRLNTALPAPKLDDSIKQSFRPGHNGLEKIEIRVVKYEPEFGPEFGPELGPESGLDGELTLTLREESGSEGNGRTVTSATFDNRLLTHNDLLALAFPPEAQSAGRTYVLEMTGDASNHTSAWGYDLDVYAAGELEMTNDIAARELSFTTRYQLGWAHALAALWAGAGHNLALIALTMLVLPLPGILLLVCVGSGQVRGQLLRIAGKQNARPRQARLPQIDPAAWMGLAMALGIAVWPILWYWLTLMGQRWSGNSLWLFTLFGWSLVLLCRRRSISSWLKRIAKRPATSSARFPRLWQAGRHWEHSALLGILLVGMAVRFLAIRDLHFPPWVDSSRHALITAIMINSGQTVRTYAPYLQIDEFPYHFGFHTLPAGLALMGGFRLETLLLVLGQILNGLAPLTMYAAGWMMTRRRDVGLTAAFLVALPFFFPGYYATWGRYTQLTGVLILPLLLALTWQLVRGARGWRQSWWIIALLVAGLFFIHIRVFLVYLPFALLVWLFSKGRNGRWLLLAGGLALLLVASRLIAFIGLDGSRGTLSAAPETYNEFPREYLNTGWERHFVWAAAAALLAAALAFWQKRSWAILPLLLAIWVAVVLGILSGLVPGVPNFWLININSAYITLFVPLALVLAIVTSRLWRALKRHHLLGQMLVATAAGATLLLLFLFGVNRQIDMLNPTTLLARDADSAGLAWARETLPHDALIAVNSWQWLGNTWAGSDGGAWLLPLNGQQSTTPPVDYVYDVAIAQQVRTFNEQLRNITDWSDASAVAWLREQGVTHIFIGARGGQFDPSQLARNPETSMLYDFDGVFIFALEPPP